MQPLPTGHVSAMPRMKLCSRGLHCHTYQVSVRFGYNPIKKQCCCFVGKTFNLCESPRCRCVEARSHELAPSSLHPAHEHCWELPRKGSCSQAPGKETSPWSSLHSPPICEWLPLKKIRKQGLSSSYQDQGVIPDSISILQIAL